MKWQGFDVTFVVPLLLGIASLALGWGLPTLGIDLPTWSGAAAVIFALGCILVAAYRALQASDPTSTEAGGAGGNATVLGDESTAKGGDGGRGRTGRGGRGGNAEVLGDRSSAVGGKGGNSG